MWDLAKAYHETTATRERVCLNGLWQWRPGAAELPTPPREGWGYFKVPGSWPGVTDYMQKDSQKVFLHPSWKETNLAGLGAAWYQREFTVPGAWAGRRITLNVEYLNSFAAVFVDGRKAGELRFPGGDLDLTSVCPPGQTHSLGLFVVALPLKGVLLSYTDSASAREVKGSVARRGLCGDVFLTSAPLGPSISDARIAPSVRKRELAIDATLDAGAPNARYTLRALVRQGGRIVRQFSSPEFRAEDHADGHVSFTTKWMPDKLWDLHTPQNVCELELSLLDAAGRVLDASWTRRFGFREFWIYGRDFYLNGAPIHLSAVPLDNAEVGAAWATYAAARESLERLKGFGINYVYTHNYGCEPGSHLSFTEILRAADDVGMLVGLSQPHFSHYDWQAPDADRNNGYARHAAYYVRVGQDHPSVVMYPMSHNATGYDEDMNPDLIDGIHDQRDTWARKNLALALRAEAIVKRLDPSRIVYHHASGNLGVMHDSNFYPNFAPAQELSDWFEHWATVGVKPVFTCEYGAPFTWDWTMYRGWYRGQREFGSAKVPWEFCVAEWNAQFFGDTAYRISEPEKADLRWEAKQFRAGALWHRWDYPFDVGSSRFDERYPIFALYVNDNWRGFRGWGVSGVSPWEYEHFWKLRPGVNRDRRELAVDWNNLQRPGFSPDYLDQRFERMDMAYEKSDWIATPAAEALLRNNRPLLAFLAGAPAHFTSKDHNYLAGQTVEKQVIVINDSREPATGRVEWTLALPRAVTGTRRVTVAPGRQARIPLRFELPANINPGAYEIQLRAHFGQGEVQEDRFTIDVAPPPGGAPLDARIALFDPKGETAAALDHIGVRYEKVDAGADLATFDILVVGKAALAPDGEAPDISRVRDGLKVVVFEQTSATLEKRFGFRVEEYGLRQVFPRVPDHPILAGVKAAEWHDWRGEATILPPRLSYSTRPRYGPTVEWAGIPVARVWRCGNRGNVASVLIEKPARGDFLPLVDGGFSLQFSPLLEFHEGRGLVIFCQLDVTARTEYDPAAERVMRNLLPYVAAWKPSAPRRAIYSGGPAFKNYLRSVGVFADAYQGGPLATDQVLLAGPPEGQPPTAPSGALGEALAAGGHALALGLSQTEAAALFPGRVTMKRAEHISTFFEPFGSGSPLAGVAPADVHNRDPREMSLVTAGARIAGDGVLAWSDDARLVFCQMAPWQFDGADQWNLKRTRRRAAVLVARLLANQGVAGTTPLLERFHHPIAAAIPEQRWLTGLYLDQPEEWDDPYRFFRW